jgi:hypothetical protein
MSRALGRLQRDAFHAAPNERRTEAGFDQAPDGEEPNILTDLPGVVDDLQTRRGIISGGAPDTIGGLSLAAIGAAASETLFPPGAEVSFRPQAERVALGALLGALSLANDSPLAETELPAPWEVDHPDLVDPVMWLVGTAYTAAGRRRAGIG